MFDLLVHISKNEDTNLVLYQDLYLDIFLHFIETDYA